MAYATYEDLEARYDVRPILDLVSDTGTPAVDAESSTRVTMALSTASGRINAACLNGKQYRVEDLAALTGDDLELLKDICCTLAMGILCRRRQELMKQYQTFISEADQFLARIRKGEHVFNIETNKAAGLPSAEGFTYVDYENEQGWRERYDGGYFPKRVLPLGR